MKFAGAMACDLGVSGLGLRSRLLADIGGESVVHRAARAMAETERLVARICLCPPGACDALRDAIADLPVEVVGVDAPPHPRREKIVRSRRLAASAWRGGPGGFVVYDEEGDLAVMAAVIARHGADALVQFQSAGPMVDPARVDRSLAEFEDGPQHIALFPPLPPGLGAAVYGPDFLAGLARVRGTASDVLRLDLDNPGQDPGHMGLIPVEDLDRTGLRLRLSADTARGLEVCRAVIESGLGVVDAAARLPGLGLGRFPPEVEIELTTRRVLPRPGEPRRPEADMDVGRLETILGDLGGEDDVVVAFAGLGDPMLHPEFARAVGVARRAGASAVHCVTDGVGLGPWPASGVDAVSVRLDAHTASTYHAVTGADRFDEAVGFVRAAMGNPSMASGFVCPTFSKRRDNEDEMGDFFEDWLKAGAWPVLTGHDDYAGQVEYLGSIRLTLPARVPCLHLSERLVLRADGSVPVCGADFRGLLAAGPPGRPLAEVWRGEVLEGLRAAHRSGKWDAFALCQGCRSWGTP